MAARGGPRWIPILGSLLLGTALASCGGDPGNAPAAPGPSPIMGDLMKAEYACMRNPADPRRAECCTGGICSRVASPALPKLRR
jgi:hypothetical protein